jgi:hypothetical protein
VVTLCVPAGMVAIWLMHATFISTVAADYIGMWCFLVPVMLHLLTMAPT